MCVFNKGRLLVKFCPSCLVSRIPGMFNKSRLKVHVPGSLLYSWASYLTPSVKYVLHSKLPVNECSFFVFQCSATCHRVPVPRGVLRGRLPLDHSERSSDHFKGCTHPSCGPSFLLFWFLGPCLHGADQCCGKGRIQTYPMLWKWAFVLVCLFFITMQGKEENCG